MPKPFIAVQKKHYVCGAPMQVNMRREPRQMGRHTYTLCWESHDSKSLSVEARGVDISRSGIRVVSPRKLPVDTLVFIQAHGTTLAGYAVVRHCSPQGDDYAIGLALNDETKATVTLGDADDVDYYAFLQISPKADWPTIHRVYRIMASRFHPDNPETGDPEKFLILRAAYETLSDPKRRAAYDASLQSRDPGTLPIFELSEFVNGIEGEMNRRLGILSLLYNRRRTSPQGPGISILDLEKRMGMPREYLDFTTWYLKSKQFITAGDNSEFVLTALGVDYVESNCSQPILQKLLNSGPRCATSGNGAGARSHFDEKLQLSSPEEQAGNR
jgi:hypothetical protein